MHYIQPPRKNYKTYQRQKTQTEEIEQASELDMAGRLEWSDYEFKTTLINILKAIMDKVDSMQEQMGNVSGEIEILRKNQTQR